MGWQDILTEIKNGIRAERNKLDDLEVVAEGLASVLRRVSKFFLNPPMSRYDGDNEKTILRDLMIDALVAYDRHTGRKPGDRRRPAGVGDVQADEELNAERIRSRGSIRSG